LTAIRRGTKRILIPGFPNLSPEEFSVWAKELLRPKSNDNYFRVIFPIHDSGWIGTGYYMEKGGLGYPR